MANAEFQQFCDSLAGSGDVTQQNWGERRPSPDCHHFVIEASETATSVNAI